MTELSLLTCSGVILSEAKDLPARVGVILSQVKSLVSGARRFFAALRMTGWGAQNDRVPPSLPLCSPGTPRMTGWGAKGDRRDGRFRRGRRTSGAQRSFATLRMTG